MTHLKIVIFALIENITIVMQYFVVAQCMIQCVDIIVVVITEISLITPPVGLNVFVLKSMLDDVKLSTIFRGVTPFWVVDIIRLMALIMLPGLVLWLPKLMAN